MPHLLYLDISVLGDLGPLDRFLVQEGLELSGLVENHDGTLLVELPASHALMPVRPPGAYGTIRVTDLVGHAAGSAANDAGHQGRLNGHKQMAILTDANVKAGE